MMADIYHDLIKVDFTRKTVKELETTIFNTEEAVSGILATMKVVGNLAYIAANSEEYKGNEVNDDLIYISHMLMTLPRIMEALEHIRTNAEYEKNERTKNGVGVNE